MIATYLTMLAERGSHHDTLRDISTSISVAVREATDNRLQPGSSLTLTSFFEGERRHRPVRRSGDGSYDDVGRLYQQIWLDGPDAAMSLTHKMERIILLLFCDTACRPSDIWRLYRLYEGWRQQIVFFDGGVKVRFFYPKEVLPGSSRANSTGYYFSTWVTIADTFPLSISTPRCLRAFLDDTSGPEYGMQHVEELDCDAQPIAWGAKRGGKWQPCSKDSLQKIAKMGIACAGMGTMTARSLRGAAPSKVVQLCPQLKPAALALGRWTNARTFDNHYCAPVRLMTDEPIPAEISASMNLQQILRHGFTPTPPPAVSVADYMKGPEFWVGKTITRLGKIASFTDGVYEVCARRATKRLFHYELMTAVSTARSSR